MLVPAGRCYGRSDLALRPGWRASLPGLLIALEPLRPVRVLSSPSRRCLGPATALAGRLGVRCVVEPALLELDFGAWEGLDWDQVPRAALDRWAADPVGFAAPGGESGAALSTRVGALADRLRRERRRLLLVSHGGPLRLLRRLLSGQPADLLAPSQPIGSLVML